QSRIFRPSTPATGNLTTPFYQFWESRNIVHYREPYRSYREIGELSLEEAFENFGVVGGTADLIERYFELFPEMQLYPDVLPTLERLAGRYRLAIVSNIDDDLLGATRLDRQFDLVCTAERAGGYKPDGTLFRHGDAADRARGAVAGGWLERRAALGV